MARKKVVKVEASAEGFRQAQDFVEEVLQARHVNASIGSAEPRSSSASRAGASRRAGETRRSSC